MSQKSKTLLKLMQQEQNYHEDINKFLESNHRHNSEHTEKKFDLKLQKSVIDLYQQIKTNIFKTEDQLLLCQIKNIIPLDKNDDLYVDPICLIYYIGCIFTIVLQNKFNLEQQIADQNQRNQNDYEEQLIKLEAEIRQHIRIEQQIKLLAETTESKLEEALQIKDDLEEELQKLKNEFQNLSVKNNNLNQKLKQQEKEMKNLKMNLIVDTNSYNNNNVVQQSNKNTLKKNNIENEFPQQQSISINIQKENSKQTNQKYLDFNQSLNNNRLHTEPQQEQYQLKNDSKKRILSTHISNNKSNNLACIVKTEINEYQDNKRKNPLSPYETQQIAIKNQTSQNVLNLINQELKRQQSIQTVSEKTSINQIKSQKRISSSQHTEANRSNNSVHSFRKPPEYMQISRPISCAEQIDEGQHPLRKDLSVDLKGLQKINADYSKNQIQVKKLLQHYKQKSSLNDSLTKKFHQDYQINKI